MAYEPPAAIFHAEAPVRVAVPRTLPFRRSRIGLAIASTLALLLALAMAPGEAQAAQVIAGPARAR